MSANEVNLVPKEVRVEKKRTGQKKFFLGSSILFLLVSVSITLVLFIINFSQTTLISAAKVNIEKEQKLLNSQLPTLKVVKKVEEKALALDTLLSKKVRFSKLLGILPSLLPQGTQITQFSVSGSEVQLAGSAYSVVDIAKFLKVVVDENKGGVIFSEVRLKSVSIGGTTGRADFGLSLVIREGVLNKP